jgi:hypothetical protein
VQAIFFDRREGLTPRDDRFEPIKNIDIHFQGLQCGCILVLLVIVIMAIVLLV